MTVAGKEVGKGVVEPGWRWSTQIKPIAGTESCEFPHFMYVITGRMRVLMDDGNEVELRPGDVAAIPLGHDAEVLGDEPCMDCGRVPAIGRFGGGTPLPAVHCRP